MTPRVREIPSAMGHRPSLGEDATSRSQETFSTVRITRTLPLPNPLALARHAKTPELGPNILFFSGGSALRDTSRVLIRYTHRSTHLITPFDSGGSSAALREAFRMPAVGDLRNRILALADQTVQGQPAVFALFSHRFLKSVSGREHRDQLARMVDGRHPLVRAVADPMRKIIRSHLRTFQEAMPEDFELRGANVGNLILTGGYLSNNRHIDPVLFLFSRLVQARGVVRPVTSVFLHLAAELENGSLVVGQHRLTGKDAPPLTSPIHRLFLVKDRERPEPVVPSLRNKVGRLVRQADLICYPMGSFYTSVVANLLVNGVGQAVAETDVPKVYVPNTEHDPEQLGLTLPRAVSVLLETLRRGCRGQVAPQQLLTFVLVDDRQIPHRNPLFRQVEKLGVQVLRAPLITAESAPRVDPKRLTEVLLSMC